ncbi:conserved hypothetical protein [Mycobacterium tuberculosis]|nr:conserved hypothetical protein [Mycobacterium tuberculosis]
MVDTSAPASRLDTDPRRAHVSLSKHPYQIGVFGSGTIGPRVYELAYQVGAEIAKQGHILISGGMTGTMEASSRGASDADGLVVGVLPGDKFTDGNAYSTIKILSGMQFARNYITGLSCHGAIVVGGSSGAYEEARRVWEGRGPVVVLANADRQRVRLRKCCPCRKSLGSPFRRTNPSPGESFRRQPPPNRCRLSLA